MTDSVKISLDLSKMSPEVRRHIPAQLCTVCTPWGEITARYTKPKTYESPMADTKMEWNVRCGRDEASCGPDDLPIQIDADLNIPNAVVGQNIEHGTSVFAAGVAALELIRNWLAQVGLPREQLDLLGIEDVTLNGVTITYLLPFSSDQEAQRVLDAIAVTGKIVNPKTDVWDSTNKTVKLPARDSTVKAYIKSLFDRCAFKAGAPVAKQKDVAGRIVRIETILTRRFLENENLLRLEQWRMAYEDDLYAKLFNRTVRKSLLLHQTKLRHKEPREEVFARLTETEAELLHWYLAGKPVEEFPSVANSSSSQKRRSALRRNLLKATDIDIDIPWEDHVRLRCFELYDTLVYHDDYNPSSEHAPWCFCRANWPNLLAELRRVYEETVARVVAEAAKEVADKDK